MKKCPIAFGTLPPIAYTTVRLRSLTRTSGCIRSHSLADTILWATDARMCLLDKKAFESGSC
jgi:hypothetical protein